MNKTFEISKFVFHHPFTYIIAGGTQSGKTTIVTKILDNLDKLVFPKIDDIFVLYKEYQSAYEHMQSNDPRVKLIHGLEFTPTEGHHSLVIIDDQMTDGLKSKNVQELFTSGVHHRSISVIFLSQNLLPQGKYARDVRLNTHYISICKTASFASQVSFLSRQLNPRNPNKILEAYEEVTKKPYTSLFLNLHPTCDDSLRVQSGILPDEEHFIYL